MAKGNLKMFHMQSSPRRTRNAFARLLISGRAFVFVPMLLASTFAIGAELNYGQAQPDNQTPTTAPSSSASLQQSGTTPQSGDMTQQKKQESPTSAEPASAQPKKDSTNAADDYKSALKNL